MLPEKYTPVKRVEGEVLEPITADRVKHLYASISHGIKEMGREINAISFPGTIPVRDERWTSYEQGTEMGIGIPTFGDGTIRINIVDSAKCSKAYDKRLHKSVFVDKITGEVLQVIPTSASFTITEDGELIGEAPGYFYDHMSRGAPIVFEAIANLAPENANMLPHEADPKLIEHQR